MGRPLKPTTTEDNAPLAVAEKRAPWILLDVLCEIEFSCHLTRA